MSEPILEIKSEEEYVKALERCNYLFELDASEEVKDELIKLSEIIDEYEGDVFRDET